MPSTAKDSLSEPTTTAGPAKNEVQKSQPGNAAGTEIPVTVHASRYSAASKGSAKLPPVHEETRTVIVLPQGAVVRLSATVAVGELVVLTNKRTGADVICRVTNIKAQPGIQNYVHLEFTQRAVDFWEESASPERGNSAGKPAAATASPAPPPAPTPISPGFRTPSSPVQESQSAPKTSVSPVEIKSAPTPLPRITPLADVPAWDSEDPVEALAAELQGSENTLTSAPGKKQSPDFPRRPRFQPFEPAVPQNKSTSKSIVVLAIAGVVVLAIGVVGGSVLLRHYRGTTAAPQLANPTRTAPAPLSAASESEAPIVDTSNKTTSLELPPSTSVKSSVAETPPAQPAPIRAPVEPVKVVVQPEPTTRPNTPVNRPSINVGRISAPKLKAAPQLNSAEPPSLLPPDANAPPSVIGESSSSTAARNPLPVTEPARPAPPKGGGELQQPKLLSSVAAVYPPLARAQHVQGDVTIDALIDATGKVAATNVLSGNPLLQKAAIESLRLWKYQPAMLNGEPIPIHIKVTITFNRG